METGFVMVLVLMGLWFPLVSDENSKRQKLVCPYGGKAGAEREARSYRTGDEAQFIICAVKVDRKKSPQSTEH